VQKRSNHETNASNVRFLRASFYWICRYREKKVKSSKRPKQDQPQPVFVSWKSHCGLQTSGPCF